MTDPAGDIRLVLDTSAIVAYANTSIAVGETIAEVADEGGNFAIPVVCLAEASRLVPPERAAGVLLLVEHPYAVVTSIDVEDWQAVAEWTRILGRVDAAAALVAAITCTGYVLTGEPHVYGNPDDMPIIPI